LEWELKSRGVDGPLVEESLSDLDENAEYELALSLAMRKVDKAGSDDPSMKNKLSSYLRRRGFGWEVIKRVFKSLGSDDSDTI